MYADGYDRHVTLFPSFCLCSTPADRGMWIWIYGGYVDVDMDGGCGFPALTSATLLQIVVSLATTQHSCFKENLEVGHSEFSLSVLFEEALIVARKSKVCEEGLEIQPGCEIS